MHTYVYVCRICNNLTLGYASMAKNAHLSNTLFGIHSDDAQLNILC